MVSCCFLLEPWNLKYQQNGTQGLGYPMRAVISGVTEMLARSIVSLCFVGSFGYTAICFADQTAWVSACFYIFPTCLYCVHKTTKKLMKQQNVQ